MKWLNAYKYKITIALFAVWMLFFDGNSVLDQWHRIAEINSLKEERDYYLEQTLETRREQEQLFSDLDALERFAREKYMMKRDNEDIYVLRKED